MAGSRRDDDYKRGSGRVWEDIWKTAQIREADSYLAVEILFGQRRIDSLKQLFSQAPGRTILNCGCGSAVWSVPFQEEGYRTVNLDISEAALRVARLNFDNRGLGGDFVRGDLERMGFKDHSFDIVMSFGVLEHFEDIRAAINEMVRVLKPGGVFLADVITDRISVYFLERLLQTLFSCFGAVKRGELRSAWRQLRSMKPTFYENRLPVSEYLNCMRLAGLENVKAKGVRPYPFINLGRFDQMYARFLRKVSRWLSKIDESESKISLHWCAIWALEGRKERN